MSSYQGAARLLLVDDDPDMLRLLTTLIEREFGGEIQIESLADAALAKNRLNEGGVDILLTDLEMPGVNGLALLRRAKRRNAYTQVLFITGHSTQEALLDALELGATDYLLKPIHHRELLHVIRQAHERQRRWQQALAGTWQRRREPAIRSCYE